MRENRWWERDRRVNSLDDERLESAVHPRDCLCTIVAVRNKFCHQRIVIGRDDPVRVGRGIYTNANAAWDIQSGYSSRRRSEGVRVLSVDTTPIACPLKTSGEGMRSQSLAPAEMRIWDFTRSTPVMNSVTGCST